MGWTAALGLVLGAAFLVPAAAQVYPNIPPNTVLGRLGGNNPGPPQAIPLTALPPALGVVAPATVRVQRVLPPPTSYDTSTWQAINAQGGVTCAAQTGTAALTTCMAAAITAAFPYASGTTAAGYDFEILGGDDVANGTGHNFGGGAVVLATTSAIQFPPIQGGKIRIGAVTLGGGGTNDSVIFDACEMCSIDFSGAQIVYDVNTSTTGMAIRIKPTQATPLDGALGFSPATLTGTSVVGRMRADLSGLSGASMTNAYWRINEMNWSTALTGGCAVQLDSPAAGQNMAANRIVIDQLHGNGGIGWAFCHGTQAPGSGAILGFSKFDLMISFDSSGSGGAFDEWGSSDQITIRADGITTGATLKFEAGACNNIAWITTNQASPVIIDNSGCTGSQANLWYVNGVLTIGGAGTVASNCVVGLMLAPSGAEGLAASSGNIASCLSGVIHHDVTNVGPRIPSGDVYGISSSSTNNTSMDTGISRDSADVIDFGNGTQGDKSATINAANVNVTSQYKVGGSQISSANLSDTTTCTSWAPTDQSGASLTFTAVTANYCKYGNIVYAYAVLTYPSTANTSAAVISLPVAVPSAGYALNLFNISVSGSGNALGAPAGGSSTFTVNVQSANGTATSPSTVAALENVGLSTKTLRFLAVYPAN